MTKRFDGQLLRGARIAASVRPERLALAVDRSVFTVMAYERGLVDPPISVLAGMAGELGLRVDDFLTEAEPVSAGAA